MIDESTAVEDRLVVSNSIEFVMLINLIFTIGFRFQPFITTSASSATVLKMWLNQLRITVLLANILFDLAKLWKSLDDMNK